MVCPLVVFIALLPLPDLPGDHLRPPGDFTLHGAPWVPQVARTERETKTPAVVPDRAKETGGGVGRDPHTTREVSLPTSKRDRDTRSRGNLAACSGAFSLGASGTQAYRHTRRSGNAAI